MLPGGGVVLIENRSRGGGFAAHRAPDWAAVWKGMFWGMALVLLIHLIDSPAEARVGRGLSWEIARDSQPWGLDPGLLTQGPGLSQHAALAGAVDTS